MAGAVSTLVPFEILASTTIPVLANLFALGLRRRVKNRLQKIAAYLVYQQDS